jgi:hypothetical protein
MENNSNNKYYFAEIPENQPFKYNLSDIFEKCIDLSKTYPKNEPVIKIGESIFGTTGDISFISGQAKSGKSTISKFILATALMKEIPESCDTLSIRSKYCEGKYVVYLDTEQNEAIVKKITESVLDIAGLKEKPKNFLCIPLRQEDRLDLREFIRCLFGQLKDIHLIIIDGITDLLSSVNDEKDSNDTVKYLMQMSSKHDTCIVSAIHELGDGKMRGHIGSEATRKCVGAISVKHEKDKKVHSISSTYLRMSQPIEPIYWNFDVNSRPVSCDAEMIEKFKKLSVDKDLEKNIEIGGILEKIYKNINGHGLTSDILKSKLLLHVPTPKANSKDPEGASKKSRDRLFKTIRDKDLLRIENEKSNGVEREIYYFDKMDLFPEK